MKEILTTEELVALRKMAASGSSYVPQLTVAEAIAAHGFAEPNGLGGIRITAEGRKYLRDVDYAS